MGEDNGHVSRQFERALDFSGSEGRFAVDTDDRWEAQPGVVFGGFVLALAVRAAGLVATASRPISISCQFLRPVRVGLSVEATVVSLRRGRTNELLSVTLAQAGKPATEAHVRAVDGGRGPTFEPLRRPALPDPLLFPDTKDAERADGTEPARFLNELEWRDSRGPFNESDVAVWWRLGAGVAYEDPWLEAARIAVGMDASGGAVVSRFEAQGHERRALPWGFSNLDGLVHFHDPVGTDSLYVETRVLTGSGGYVSALTEAWSVDARLVATSITQLTLFEMPERRHGIDNDS